MGSFIDEKNIINHTIENYNNFVNDKGKFIEGHETFTTYYSKNQKASTNDVGLGATTEIIGCESPIKFNKIENFPLYNFNEMQLQYEYDDEMGLDSSIDGEAIILPGTIKPLVDDFFSVSYLNKRYLFRINNVEGSSLGSKFFYKIEYSLTGSNIDYLEERQVEERYEVIYDNIGTKNKSLIKESLIKYVEQIDDKIDELKKVYVKYFYNKNMNLFILHDEIYDNYLHEFISQNSLFIKQKTFLENILVKPALYLDHLYANTIFSILELNDKEAFAEMYTGFVTLPVPKDQFNIFSVQYNNYLSNNWIPKCDETNFLVDLYNAINLNKTDKWYIEIFLAYFKDYDHLEDKVKVILDLLNNRISNNMNMYILVPCFIFILLKLKNIILNK